MGHSATYSTFFLRSVADTQILSSLLLTIVESNMFFPLKSTWPEPHHILLFLADSKLLILKNSVRIIGSKNKMQCV